MRSLNLILPAYGEYHDDKTKTFCILTNRKLNEDKILPYITISNRNVRGRYDGIDGFYMKTSDFLNEYPLYKNVNNWFIFYDNLSLSWKLVNGDPRIEESYYVMLENSETNCEKRLLNLRVGYSNVNSEINNFDESEENAFAWQDARLRESEDEELKFGYIVDNVCDGCVGERQPIYTIQTTNTQKLPYTSYKRPLLPIAIYKYKVKKKYIRRTPWI